MLTPEVIKKLNTQNIAESNKEKVEEFMIKYWDNASPQRKKKCIALGDYKDSRPFWQTKKTGKISVRMVISLALGLSPKINPFFITGESDDTKYSDSKLAEFLRQTGFKDAISHIEDNHTSLDSSLNTYHDDDEELNFAVNEFANIIEKRLLGLENNLEISIDDLIILLKNLEIKSKISNDEISKIKLKLVKLILLS
ncbi:hypothetical protein VT91_03820 [Clostridium sporogenes]|uniref:hypothetical protein n=1 Tax=Clostridium botulinum TaxID=1491 RepID=UPI000717B4EB|nr:hypothetical protein [Clostridium botulinum]KRU26765.1 hypothetical protein VT28_29900 [Clostridium sporogenes]KRU29629.1 hypothetical protein WG71_14740 [Clostridium sporogenes]KRU35394.1 hypothetical protein VT91_03820 [Clostridium sporogenes]KRU49620.1 hypothetical protein VT95_02870 [Clostridium sporogenes]MBZ1328484.1 hypothetical protein [Clostridium botulinum]